VRHRRRPGGRRRQRILEVIGDTATLAGTTDSWLSLPQIPVTTVASVTLDGTAVTAGAVSTTSSYKRIGSRLWRGDGWAAYVDAPSEVVVVNTHGYPAGSQHLQRAPRRHAQPRRHPVHQPGTAPPR
jgi:hypothetical protein